MAIVTRYFSTTAAGLGDGTSWANRAALFSSGNWSSVITGFNFSGSDSLEALVEGGLTYTCSQAMASGLFANAPTIANLLFVHGCDSDGEKLVPAYWVSAGSEIDTSTFPTISCASNINISSLVNAFWSCIAFSSSARTSEIMQAGAFDNVALTVSNTGSSIIGFNSPSRITNSQVLFTGGSFASGISTPLYLENVRIDGSSATTAGTRIGVNTGAVGYWAGGLTVVGCAGGGVVLAAAQVSRSGYIWRSTIVGCGSSGILCNGTASQTAWHQIHGCYVSGNSAYGINANGSFTNSSHNRLRNNTSGNHNGFGNYPTDQDYTSAGTDSDEFVNAAGGDYRIKNTAAIWGKGYGAGDQPSAGSGGSALHLGSLGQTGIGVF